MSKTALVIGGTGPTGPSVVAGLGDRGYQAAVLHRGVHETPDLPDVEHIHADPHFDETVRGGLGDREFDLVVALYGRTRITARVLAGRCERFIGVGGLTVYEGNADTGERHPSGMRLLASEDSPLARSDGGSVTPTSKFVQKMVDTERTVLELHNQKAFSATWLRYAMVYGPRSLVPWEWSVVKRVLDDRPFIILPDGGLSVRARLAVANATALMMLVVDRPDASAGQVFNCADELALSLRQWTEVVARAAGRDLEILSMPWALARPAVPLFPYKGTTSHHTLVDVSRARNLLGYREVVPPDDALRDTVAWYLENPVTSDRYPNLADRFDYAWEDTLAEAYREFQHRCAALLDVPDAGVMHDYPHPKTPGEGDVHGR